MEDIHSSTAIPKGTAILTASTTDESFPFEFVEFDGDCRVGEGNANGVGGNRSGGEGEVVLFVYI